MFKILKVCKYSLIGFCPHDLFVNTRADLGPCNKIHDEELKKQYEKSSRYGRLGYEEDYERFLRSLLMDVERKIKRGIERLKLTQSDQANQKTPLQVKQERVAFLKEKINELIKEAETLGEEGRIEEAQSTLESCEKYKTECKYLENQLELAQHNAEQKQMEVCDVCGSFLIVNDAQSRVEEHISGKQHMGYAKLRSALEEIRKKDRKSTKNEKKRELLVSRIATETDVIVIEIETVNAIETVIVRENVARETGIVTVNVIEIETVNRVLHLHQDEMVHLEM